MPDTTNPADEIGIRQKIAVAVAKADVDEVMHLIAERERIARLDENIACQAIIRSKWGTNDQLWDMQDRIKTLTADAADTKPLERK